jgi:putative transcriptional regulator
LIPCSHPSPSLLADFATGRLSRAPGVAVSAHLEWCAVCSTQVQALEDIEGDSLAAVDPVALAENALADVMMKLGQQPSGVVGLKRSKNRLADVQIPQAAQQAGLGPRRWLAAGLWVAPVLTAPIDSWRTFLLRAPAGTKIPAHSHRGDELIAVLTGAICDGQTYAAGDFAEISRAVDHHLMVTSDGPCACLIAVEGGISWRGWAKIIKPLTGI